MTKLSEKYNDSCVKMFEFLKLLLKEPVDYNTVITLFTDNKTVGRSNPNVALNKYLNTLRILGITVQKQKNHFFIKNLPYKIDFNMDDLKIINIFKETLEIMPKGKNFRNIQFFINALEIRYSILTQEKAAALNSTKTIDFSFLSTELKKQIEKCESYCQDKRKIEVIYKNITEQEVSLVCSPVELKYIKKKTFLSVNIDSSNTVMDIPLDKIISITQLRESTAKYSSPTTSVFKLKNRLAKNYKLREWEHSEGYDNDGWLVIINKNEDKNSLLKRLMRYGEQCVLCSPKYLKDEMLEMINKTIENNKE